MPGTAYKVQVGAEGGAFVSSEDVSETGPGEVPTMSVLAPRREAAGAPVGVGGLWGCVVCRAVSVFPRGPVGLGAGV